MKRFFGVIALACAVAMSSCNTKFDDGDLWNNINGLEDRVSKLEEQCKAMNTNIASLQTIVKALQNQKTVTKVEQTTDGCTIHFSDGTSAVIRNGKDSGSAPVVSIKQDTDGNYYWTLDGDYILVDGHKVKAQGTDGKDGQDGTDGKDGQDGTNGRDGADGTNGKDGVTPQLKIDGGYWYITYDNGATWTRLGKATGENGKDGADGKDGLNGQDGKDGTDGKDGRDGDGIKVTQDEKSVYFELPDGTVIAIQKNVVNEDTRIITFKDPKTKAICIKAWDSNGDGELSYSEASRVTSLRKYFRQSDIESFDEFQFFTGVIELEQNTFFKCSELRSIILPETLNWIEADAFHSCTNLGDIVVPNNVTWVGDYAFAGCYNLKKATVGANATNWGNWVFQYCSNLTQITILGDLPSINHCTFYGCTNLVSVTISKNVTSIGYGAFSKCNSLTSIYCKPIIPPLLDSDAFYDTTSTFSIYVPRASVSAYKSADGWSKYASKIVGYDL